MCLHCSLSLSFCEWVKSVCACVCAVPSTGGSKKANWASVEPQHCKRTVVLNTGYIMNCKCKTISIQSKCVSFQLTNSWHLRRRPERMEVCDDVSCKAFTLRFFLMLVDCAIWGVWGSHFGRLWWFHLNLSLFCVQTKMVVMVAGLGFWCGEFFSCKLWFCDLACTFSFPFPQKWELCVSLCTFYCFHFLNCVK